MHSFDSNSTVPAFLVKLWKLVEDPTCDDLIAWNESGYSFIIKDQSKFAKDLLPQYFKHNNMASFIRQLNMYGFKKVMNYERSGLKNENNEMEFQHGCFIRERSELLELIKRKISNAKVAEPPVKSNPKDILTDLTSIREKQENMDNMLLKMKQENELLWRELTSMRQKHKAQEQIIQKVIQFLVSIVQRSNTNIGVQRKITRMLHDSPTSKSDSSKASRTIDLLRKNNQENFLVPELLSSPLGPVIHEVLDGEQEENATSPSPNFSVKSPDSGTLVTKSNPKSNAVSLLSNASKSSAMLEPLRILEALQKHTQATSSANSSVEESILGLPIDYTNAVVAKSPQNLELEPFSYDILQNVNSIHDNTPLGNVISIGEDGTINEVVALTEEALPVANDASIPESPASEFISSAVNSPTVGDTSLQSVAAFGDLQTAGTSGDLLEFDDQLLTESLHTPKILLGGEEEVCTSSDCSPKKTNTVATRSGQVARKSIMQKEHDYQLATPESSSLVKNVLSNHLLSVDEKLNLAQDRLASNPWNLDVQSLLGLFSSDDMLNYDSFSSQLGEELNIKSEPNDIIGNELVQFNPNILETDIDFRNSPLFEALAPDENSTSTDLNCTSPPKLQSLLDEVMKETSVSDTADFSTSDQAVQSYSSNKRPKMPKSTKGKRRKVK